MLKLETEISLQWMPENEKHLKKCKILILTYLNWNDGIEGLSLAPVASVRLKG